MSLPGKPHRVRAHDVDGRCVLDQGVGRFKRRVSLAQNQNPLVLVKRRVRVKVEIVVGQIRAFDTGIPGLRYTCGHNDRARFSCGAVCATHLEDAVRLGNIDHITVASDVIFHLCCKCLCIGDKIISGRKVFLAPVAEFQSLVIQQGIPVIPQAGFFVRKACVNFVD